MEKEVEVLYTKGKAYISVISLLKALDTVVSLDAEVFRKSLISILEDKDE